MRYFIVIFFMLAALAANAQTPTVNDSIYPLKTTLHKGDSLVMVFKAKNGVMRLTSDGGCSAKLMSLWQFKKPTGWAQVFHPPQMDCGLPYVDTPNGNKILYPQNREGTYRMVFFADGKIIETDEFTVE